MTGLRMARLQVERGCCCRRFPHNHFREIRDFQSNIKGNSYRLVAAIDCKRRIVVVKWIGTHSDYDKLDVRTVQYDGSSN